MKKNKRLSRLGLVGLINVLTVFLLVVTFSPNTIPFLRAEPQRFALPISQPAPDPVVATVPKVVISGKPVRIKVPSVSVDVQVIDGVYDSVKQTWTLSKTQAHYALMTALANNDNGNTFIYGHSSKNIFGKLLKAQVGAEAIVETENGKIFHYNLVSYQDVKPNDTGFFQYKGKPVLTVQTCSGTWYETRRLLTFEFVSVEDKL